jgi:hypothetical protein
LVAHPSAFRVAEYFCGALERDRVNLGSGKFVCGTEAVGPMNPAGRY